MILTRLYVAGVVTLAVGAMVLSYRHHLINRGVETERARVVKQAEKKNATAQTARRSVTDDNVNRLLSRYFRDKP